MSALNDLKRMAEWLEHASEDAFGVPDCNPEECHKCIALRALEEASKARAEGAAAEREACAKLAERPYGDEVAALGRMEPLAVGAAFAAAIRARSEPSFEGSACSECGHSQDLHRPACVGDGNECLCASFKPEGSAPVVPKCWSCGHRAHTGLCTARSGGTAYACGCSKQNDLKPAPKPAARELALKALLAAQEAMSDMGLQSSYAIAWDMVCAAVAVLEAKPE